MTKKHTRLTEAEQLARAIRIRERDLAERAAEEARSNAFLKTLWWFDQSLLDD
jgi:hypothetical protein